MTIHFYTKGDERLPDSRQRAFRIAEELNARGIKSVVHWPPILLISETRWPKKFSLIIATIRSLFTIKKGDIVFLQRAISNKYFFVTMVVYLKLFRRKMIFDFDDAIYMHDFYKTKKLTQMADAVIVCSRALEKWAKQYNNNVHIIHTTVKLSAYEKFTKDYSREAHPLIVGWIGTAKFHYTNLQFLAAVLEKLVEKNGIPFTFVLIGAGQDKKVHALFESIPVLSVTFIDSLEWTNQESIPREIQKFDIGVNPLVERGEWNLARSSFKPYEYMACGVANVTSNIGEITHVIEDGINGMLADSVNEWVDKLGQLIADKTLRARIGRAGQETLRTREAYEAIIPRMIDLINSL